MLWSLVVWTVVIWVGRISNILDDPERSSWQAMLPAVMIVLAVVAAGRALTGRPRWAGLVLAGVTIGVWAVRLPLMAVGDHSGGFVAVHAVLAVVSIALAALALKAERAWLDRGGSAGRAAHSRVTAATVSPEPGGEARRG